MQNGIQLTVIQQYYSFLSTGLAVVHLESYRLDLEQLATSGAEFGSYDVNQLVVAIEWIGQNFRLQHSGVIGSLFSCHTTYKESTKAGGVSLPLICMGGVVQDHVQLYVVMQSRSTAFLCGKRLLCTFNGS